MDSIITKAEEHANSIENPAEAEFGLTSPFPRVPRDLVKQVVEPKFAQMYATFEEDLKQRSKQAADSVAQRTKLDTEVSLLAPQDLFQQAVEASVTKRLVALGLSADIDDNLPDPTSSALTFVESLPKNRESPPVVEGHNPASNASPKWMPRRRRRAQPSPAPGAACSFSVVPRGKNGPRRGNQRA